MAKLILFIFLTSFSVNALGQLNANFSANNTAGCTPILLVNFTDNSAGSPTSWNWDFGNGNTSTIQNPSATYTAAGTYTVKLTITKGSQNDIEIKSNYITVYKLPVAHFNYTSGNICEGSNVSFLSQPNVGGVTILNYQWDFGDGTVTNTTINNTSHNYVYSGLLQASLLVTDVNGCENIFDTLIDIKPQPLIAFTANPSNGCDLPFIASFINGTTGGLNYNWSFGDGGSSSLQSPTHSYQNYGNYSVQLKSTSQFGCVDSSIKIKYIKVAKFIADFSAGTTACVGDTVKFIENNSSAASAFLWSFGDGDSSTLSNPFHNYAIPGIYTCSLIATDSSGCSDTIVKTNYITVYSFPVVTDSVSENKSCHSPFTANFFASSIAGATYSWNFGDGSASTLQNPQHTFTSSNPLDSFEVIVSVTGPGGCTTIDTLKTKIYIVPFNAGFVFQPQAGGCIPLTYAFNDTSHAPTAITRTWDFGDGSAPQTTSLSTIQHDYLTAGTFIVTETLNTTQGCTDIVVDSVIAGFPVAANVPFLIDTICFTSSIQMDALPGLNTTDWIWLWGDGKTSSGMSVNLNYQDTGTYAVSVMAGYNGCFVTAVPAGLITVLLPIPKFDFSPHSCTDPYSYTLYNSSIGADSIIWNFGDSTYAYNIDTITHTWLTRGVHVTTLTAFNFSTGCEVTYSIPFTLTDPVADYTATPVSGCKPLAVNFHSLGIDVYYYYKWILAPPPAIETYTINTYYTYVDPGSYDVTHIVKDIFGCPDTLTIPNLITVYGPDVDFAVNAQQGCAPFTATFIDNTISLAPVDSANWNFGDGSPIDHTLGTVTHTFSQKGLYTVTLEVYDSTGCHFYKTKQDYINVTELKAQLNVDTFACRYEEVFFSATGTQALGGIFKWDFGDGFSITTLNDTVSHVYVNDSTYTISLIVTDAIGCISTIAQNILVQGPQTMFTYTSLSGCGYNQTNFYNTSTGTGIVSNHWFFGDGTESFLKDSVAHNYTIPGYYNVLLITTNAAGCSDSMYVDSLIEVPGPYGTFSFSPDFGCPPLTVTFIKNDFNATEFIWDFGDGNLLSSLADTIVHTYTSEQIANPSLSLGNYLADSTHCQLPAVKIGNTIVVKNKLQTSITGNGITSDNLIIEAGQLVNLTANVNTGNSISYFWFPDSGLSCNFCDNPSFISVAGNQYYTVTATDLGGCIAKDSILISANGCEQHLIIPNVVTPNGDFLNDNFEIEQCANYEYQINIYDRWGSNIYNKIGTEIIWNANNSKGEMVPEGVYYYVLKYNSTTKTGFIEVLTGTK